MDVCGQANIGDWCLKVLFNAYDLTRRRTGIGLYAQHLLEHLLVQDEIEPLYGLLGTRILDRGALAGLLGADQDNHGPSNALITWVRGVPGAYAARQALREWKSARAIQNLADQGFIYHEPNFIPVRYAGPLIITVHDLSHVRFPEFHPPERVAFLNRHLPGTLARADRVLTDSHFVAGEIADVYSVPAAKIAVAHLGADAGFHPRGEGDVATTLQAFGLRHHGFLLSVATLEPRKNLERLLDAYSTLPESMRREFPLVLVGSGGWKNATLRSRVNAMQARGEAIHTGYLPRAQVLDLYAAAAVFAYPSLYEGFGLPVLEAFASGVPVLTSNISSLPEVSGGAALEVDPFAVEGIAEGLRALLDDAALRARHAALGQRRAQAFSWKLCAEQTIAVYRQLA